MNTPFYLKDAIVGQRVRIHELHSGPELCTRLRELGFCENAVVRCMTVGDTAIICEVCNTRIGLNSSLAGNISVMAMD